MAKLNLQAFVETKYTYERALRLNEAVSDCDIILMAGGSGAGKDGFLDWWWQHGASRKELPEDCRIISTDIVYINLAPAPSKSVPMTCVTFSMIWDALCAIERAVEGGDLARPRGRTRSWHTEGQFLTLFHDNVLPMVTKYVQPRAIVVGDAQFLDESALLWLLKLRTFAEFGRPRLARHALMLCARVEPDEVESSKFATLMNQVSDTRTAWPKKLLLSPMSNDEFGLIIATLVRRNLNAIFGSDVNAKSATIEFGTWTAKDWRLLVELVKVLDKALGPDKASGEPRILTQAVMERVRELWLKRSNPAIIE